MKQAGKTKDEANIVAFNAVEPETKKQAHIQQLVGLLEQPGFRMIEFHREAIYLVDDFERGAENKKRTVYFFQVRPLNGGDIEFQDSL